MTYNYRKIRLLGLTIKEGCNPKLTKTLATGYYPFTQMNSVMLSSCGMSASLLSWA